MPGRGRPARGVAGDHSCQERVGAIGGDGLPFGEGGVGDSGGGIGVGGAHDRPRSGRRGREPSSPAALDWMPCPRAVPIWSQRSLLAPRSANTSRSTHVSGRDLVARCDRLAPRASASAAGFTRAAGRRLRAQQNVVGSDGRCSGARGFHRRRGFRASPHPRKESCQADTGTGGRGEASGRHAADRFSDF